MEAPLVVLLTVISSGAGAYVGAYLKKKGENFATHEDMAKLVEQTAAITQAAKQIEAAITDKLWQRQRNWEVRRDVLIDIMSLFGEVEYGISNLLLSFTGNPTPADTKSQAIQT